MSQAINLNLDEADVVARCREAGIGISAIESLLSGGTRLVCSNSEGADEIRLRFQDHIISGDVMRDLVLEQDGPR